MGNAITNSYKTIKREIMIEPRVEPSIEKVLTKKFHPPLETVSESGYYLNNIYIPEEVLLHILSFIDVKDILNASLVTKAWCNLIKSYELWSIKYTRRYSKKPKKLPWYVFYALFATEYFDRNLIKNGNGEERFKHWYIVKNYGDEFKIEDPPNGAQCLPENVPEFNGCTSCFATSYYECIKGQSVSFEKSRLMRYIFDNFKPHIYVSEWIAPRFDCGSRYKLTCCFYGNQNEDFASSQLFSEDHMINSAEIRHEFPQWADTNWIKKELWLMDYEIGLSYINFIHEGQDSQFWKGHYGCKMAGGVLKILFDSIQPLEK